MASYWIDTLVLEKTEGNTYATLLHHPFLFKGKTNASSRRSKKDFWRHCRGDLRQVKTYQAPITTLILRIKFFAICLSFSSPPLHPCRFIRPLYLSSLSLSICLFLPACFLFSCVLVCLLVVMASPLPSASMSEIGETIVDNNSDLLLKNPLSHI